MEILLNILNTEVKGLLIQNSDTKVMVCYKNISQLNKIKNVLYFLNCKYDSIEANKCIIVSF